ncbi:ABC transporter ATP-binding protein [Candidatus Trichorickettsia mobilis]|nr:ABC transporter transmembrane domain-containing protein [Candidatus Trichorickettsia mobilis]
MYIHQSLKLTKYIKLYKQDIIIVMISIISVSGSLLMLGQAFKQLIDNGLTTKYISSVNNSISLICLLIIIFGISSFFRSYFINKVAEKITAKIRNEAVINLLRLDISYFEDSKIGNIISCLIADVELIAKLIIDLLSFVVRNLLMLIGSMGLMFIHSTKLSLIVLSVIPLLLIPILKLGRHVRALSKNALTLQGDIAANLTENFTNIHTLYAFNQQQRKINEFIDQTNIYLQYASSRLKIRAIFFAGSISVVLAAITLVIWVGSKDIVTNSISSGQMISFIYYAIIAGMSAGGIAEFIGEAQKPYAAVERVFDLLNLKPQRQLDTHANITLVTSTNNITFNNVSFSYPSRPLIKILNNITFKIHAGQFIGIVGRSGAGKSTIMQLLLKFYLPTTGNIMIGNQDIATTDTIEVRKLIAYVPQDPSIFSGTIRSNIAFSKPDAHEEEIIHAATVTGIMDFVHDLKDGLNTQIGEKGVRLSGGQKQRIAISRAILYQPEILLLDEATSALDSESEQRLFAELQNFMRSKTIISIAHRISTIENADEILVIDKGALSARGTHDQLLTTSNIYRILCEEQIISFT